MDAKQAFDEIRARFSSRPLFQEMERDLRVMTHRISQPFTNENSSYCRDDRSIGRSSSTPTGLLRKLPPPIVRPAVVETLLHHSSALPVWEEKQRGGNDSGFDRCHWEESPGEGCSSSQWARVGGRVMGTRASLSCSPPDSFLSGSRVGPPIDFGAEQQHSRDSRGRYSTHEAGGVQTPPPPPSPPPLYAVAGDCSQASSHGRGHDSNDSRGGTQAAVTVDTCERPRSDGLRFLRELDETSILQQVRHALSIYKHREEEEEAKFPAAPPAAPITDAERALHWSAEVSAQPLTEATRSALAELEELERKHHAAAAAEMAVVTPMRFQEERRHSTGVAPADDMIMRCAKIGNSLRGDHPARLEVEAPAPIREITAAATGSLPTEPRRRRQQRLLRGPTDNVVVDRGVHVATNLREWDSTNEPRLGKNHSSVLRPANTDIS
ncbi:hypothetical protein DQ04_00211120 [Trypanosoma grayi]|uniref:hypothetical protein n=1 Tax=Trypanosoma grayi TaxID=71804 RepID=UPI0004F46BDB|nr:hypothetical protein DQ04_00211120 [Trypanosoma grayi]KEG15029.1 hypothetical protein DQ04_00211120 [Trypanosoma grayi]